MRILPLAIVVLAPALLAPTEVRAQGDDCCTVTAVDAVHHIVTAIQRSDGRMFRFSVSPADLKSVNLCDGLDTQVQGVADGGPLKVMPATAATPVKGTLMRAPGEAGSVIAVHDYESGGGLQVVLESVKRNPDSTVTVSWAYCNDGERKNLQDDLRARAFHMELLDPASKTSFNVIRVKDSQHGDYWLMANHHESSQLVFLGPNAVLKTWAKFPTPEGKTVTVIIPGTAPFENVAINE